MKDININKYDILIIGAGFAGSTIAYLAAKEKKRVLILEKRNHIAGNMYDEKDQETGILVQRYGPHIFFTDSQRAYNLVTEIAEWKPVTIKARVDINGQLMPYLFNNSIIDTFFSEEKCEKIKSRLLLAYPNQKKATIFNMLRHEDPFIREYAEFLFENDYKPYTIKHWGIKPEELDISVLERAPIRLDYVDNSIDSRYQILPKDGFTDFFKKMLGYDGIDVKLNIDANDFLTLDFRKNILKFGKKEINIPVVYSGALDELLKYKYGKLPYRSLDIKYRTLDDNSFQETPVVVQPFAVGYNRIVEYSKLPPQETKGKTIITYEYPIDYELGKGLIPYYPVLTEASKQIHDQYLKDVSKIRSFFPCGRLADFRYYNMDHMIERSMDVYDNIKNHFWV